MVATPACTVWVPATVPFGSCFIVTLPTPLEAGTVAVFAAAPVDTVTGGVTGILTVTIVVGVALIGVDTDDWDMVLATTGLART